MKKKNVSPKNNRIKKIFANKLFIISLTLYILIPIITLFVVYAKVPSRTIGTYECYENNILTGRIILGNKHFLQTECFAEESVKDVEFSRGKTDGLSWSYRVSDWYKEEKFNNPKYEHLSREYIRFKHDSNDYYYTVFFFVNGDLYSEYLCFPI